MNAPRMWPVRPRASAEIFSRALSGHGVAADVHDGYGLALVSVWVGLVVWCDGYRYWWRTGWNAERRRVIYAWHPANEPDRAARRVLLRYNELREQGLSDALAELVRDVQP
ncbi:hypothetical protein [Nonomuraea sp. NPDC003804]|uniref:hypothetical protein n=1 Tax=Nonomuraea sp. NPDC003804 TaxID=3154547 RepID=UPI0033BDCB66